jgi:hypothetical protein
MNMEKFPTINNTNMEAIENFETEATRCSALKFGVIDLEKRSKFPEQVWTS